MLKAPIEGEGIPTKGTPQGGILSPLLANVVLNDLDWWIANQWEKMKTKHEYYKRNKYPALKKFSNLKEMFIVRYADDSKIFTTSHKNATKIYHAVKGYLKDRLNLEISPEKSMITNLRKRRSDFLGFSLKANKKGKKYVGHTYISKKAKEKIKREIRLRIKELQKKPSYKNISNYNAYVLGIQNYYRIATHVNKEFSNIAYCLSRTINNRLKRNWKKGIPKKPSVAYKKHYKNKFSTFGMKDIHLFPIADIKFRKHVTYTQEKCDYTKEGRKLLEHKYLSDMVKKEIERLKNVITKYRAMEYLDNRISLYSMQKGICAITGKFLLAEEVHCHHKKPRKLGGTDEFKNLAIISKIVHRLIHATKQKTVENYMKKLQLDGKQLKKLNMYRKKCNLREIVI